MASGVNPGGFGGLRSPNFTPLGGAPKKGGRSGVSPGGFGNFGNTNFSGGPKLGYVPPQAAPAPAPAPAAAPAAAPPNYPSPYDSLYFNQLAQANNAANQKIAAYNADIANGQTNLNSTLAQLAKNQVLAQQNAQNAENSRGGFAQGILGQTEGRIGQQFLTQETNDQTKYAQNKAAWNAAIAGIQQGLPLTQIALGLASAARQAALGLQATPDTSSSGGEPAPQPQPQGASGPPKFKSTSPEPRSGSGARKGGKGRGSFIKPGGWRG